MLVDELLRLKFLIHRHAGLDNKQKSSTTASFEAQAKKSGATSQINPCQIQSG
jgi:hypothetical protein